MITLLAPLALLAVTVWAACGGTGLLYLVFWAAAAVPGLPLARRLTGNHGLWIVGGAAAGYAVTCLAIWVCVAAGWTTAPALVTAWAITVILGWLAARSVRQRSPLVGTWTTRDQVAFCAVLLLVPALMVLPYRHLGAVDAAGARYYRAYFTADFVWHTALTSELQRMEMPPRNPYLASAALHYYWTYFLVPATVTARGPAVVSDVQNALKVNAIGTAFLLLGAVYLLARTAGRRRAAMLGVALVVLASSAEGISLIASLLGHDRPLASLRYVNVDAVTAWWYDGLRVDGIHRTMYYTPQHGLSCTLGLLALVPVALGGATLTLGATVIAGLLLGLATALNPFLGAAFCGIYGLAVAFDAVFTRPRLAVLARHAAAAVPPVLAVLWGVATSMGEGAGNALTLGWAGNARHAPVITLLLSLGPILVPAIAAAWPDGERPAQPLRTAGAAILVGLMLLYFVMLTDRSWVGFRAGQVLIAALAIPLTRIFDRLFGARRPALAYGLFAAVLLIGAPTTIVDAYNAQDIGNRAMGPGFPWTVVLSPSQRAGLDWIRTHTAPTDIVQAEPIVRGRAQWSLIPSFAQRRMAAGLPISLLPSPAYDRGSQAVRRIFTAATPEQARTTARQLGIAYLWVDADDARAYPEGVRRLRAAPASFRPVFTNADVTVYAVQ